MRIISGIYNRRILFTPDSDRVRPTSDRAKESLFNMLSVRYDFDGMEILDLFCGTGNLGLECLSRGAAMCCFVDKDIKLVQKNIEMLKASDKCEVVRSDVIMFLKTSVKKNFDMVFCDPPYDYDNYSGILEEISQMKTDLVLEHSDKFRSDLKFDKQIIFRRKIGTVNFTLFDFS
ncbi:MAG TPA: 16S rRNA (guanine(966)-N(2))-methyltransferase RsmD [Ignavibacteria bacterium]|nr:16S rRNA (guanine(966)-N(2))-methyltransferase RsmD [Ignavibacteria bacterium]